MPANMHAANFAPEKGCFSNQLEVKNWKQQNMLNFQSYHDHRFLLNLPNAFSMFSSIPRGSRLELLGKARYKNIKWFKIGGKQLNSFYIDLSE